jgi:site-specific DNA recombinase
MQKYARYIRISDEDQSTYSIDAQLKATETYIKARGGQIVETYIDDGRSARSDKRENFVRMRDDARKRKFDALVVHKFDRLNRNRFDALAIKTLLRREYTIAVLSCCEPSEETDGVMGSLIEGILECVAEWYSKNLATETAKGRKEKHSQGLHNGFAPFGYVMVNKMLEIEPDEEKGVILAFEAYSTGKYGYADTAKLLNEAGFRSKSGRPFSKDTVREIIRNEIYIGRVRYQETRYNSNGSRNFTAPVVWVQGKHEPIITVELFEKCVGLRAEKRTYSRPTPNKRPYLLKDLVYCYDCYLEPKPEADFPSWGKMYCRTHSKHKTAYYRCHSRELGYSCQQTGIPSEMIDTQVLEALWQLKPPTDWRQHMIEALAKVIGQKDLETRLNEIKQTIERMDFRFDHGFITNAEDYIEKRIMLQSELEQLTPIPNDDLERAADLLDNFGLYFEACGDDIEKQNDMLKTLINRVYVKGDRVMAIELKAEMYVVSGREQVEIIMGEEKFHCWARRGSNPRPYGCEPYALTN